MRKYQILVITTGEGVDFKILCCVRALEDFDIRTQIQSFKRLLPRDNDMTYARQEMFLAWMMEKRFIERTVRRDGLQWWLGLDGELFEPLR